MRASSDDTDDIAVTSSDVIAASPNGLSDGVRSPCGGGYGATGWVDGDTAGPRSAEAMLAWADDPRGVTVEK